MTYDKTRDTVSAYRIVYYLDRAFFMDWQNRFIAKVGFGMGMYGHKRAFGRQSYCMVSNCRSGLEPDRRRRYWVWEFDGYRVLVTHDSGPIIEVEPDITDVEKIKGLMDAYLAAWPEPTEVKKEAP